MDSLTHVVLGAVLGGAIARQTLGRKAYGWGAALSSLPDADVLWAGLAGEFGQWTAHRAFTHALWFGPVCGVLLAWLVWRYYRRVRGLQEPLSVWVTLFVVCLVAHALLDGATSYGTQLLSPFVDTRFSFYAVGIIDPFYTGLLALAWISAAWLAVTTLRKVYVLAILLSSVYIGYGVQINAQTTHIVRELTRSEHVQCYPTLLQLYLRSCAVTQGNQREVVFYSAWRDEVVTRYQWTQVDDARVHAVMQSVPGQIFAWFTNDQWLAYLEPQADGRTRVLVRDLRYVAINDPESMMWGLEAWFDAKGVLETPPSRFKAPPRERGRTLGAIWTAAFGDS